MSEGSTFSWKYMMLPNLNCSIAEVNVEGRVVLPVKPTKNIWPIFCSRVKECKRCSMCWRSVWEGEGGW